MQKKRIITLLLAVILLLSAIPVFAAPGEDLSKRVYITDFKFVSGNTEIKSLSALSSVGAKFYIERTDEGDGDQEFVAMLQMFDNGKLTGIKTACGKAEKGKGKIPVTIPSLTTGADISKTKVSVVILAGYDKLIPLAPSAILSSDNCKIKTMKIGGKNIELKENVYEYSIDLTINENDLPIETIIIPYDLSSKIEVSGTDGNADKITVKSTSSDGLKSVTYNVNLDLTVTKNSSLKSISVDGVEISDFVPDKYIYYVNVPLGKNYGNVTCETYYSNATYSVKQADSLPGCAKITVNAPGMDISTYEVRFAKTVTLTPSHIGMKQYKGDKDMTVWDVENESMPAIFAGTSGSFKSSTVQINSKFSDYSDSTRIAFLDFDGGFSEGSIITDATISINYIASSFNNFNTMTPEILTCTDSGWIKNPSSYGANTFPAFMNVTAHKKAIPSTTVSGSVISATTKLSPELLNINLDFAVRLKEYADSVKDWMYLKIEEDTMPKLTVSYYTVPAADENDIGDIKTIPITNKEIK